MQLDQHLNEIYLQIIRDDLITSVNQLYQIHKYHVLCGHNNYVHPNLQNELSNLSDHFLLKEIFYNRKM
jgi:hypothetical protein